MKYVFYLGYACIPLAFLSHLLVFKNSSVEPIVTFVLAGLGVLPLAHLMGEATEHLAERTGPTWGGLLNATFGNAAELIIAIIALTKGANEIVKASITGSIIGNLLLVGGAAMLVGGWRRKAQSIATGAVEAYGGLLMVAVAGMLVPAIFHFTGERLHDRELASHELSVSIATSVILMIVYVLGLLFTLRTHTHLFTPPPKERSGAAILSAHIQGDPTPTTVDSTDPAASHTAAEGHGAGWSVGKSITMLLVASAGVGIVAELLVGSAEATAHQLGWSPVFVGVILLAIIGNAAEHSTALLLAHNDDMDTAMTIVFQSSLQIALFVAPFLVFAALFLSHVLGLGQAVPLNLVFTPLEVVAVILTVLTVIILGRDGKTNWFEGALLLALYAILAIAFFNVPHTPGVSHDSGTPATAPTLTH